MALLSDLDQSGARKNVILLFTPSTKMVMFLKDKVKRMYGCNSESTIDLENKTSLKQVKQVTGVSPPLSQRWFVDVDLDKVPVNDVAEAIKYSTTCVFFCLFSKYKDYKAMKEELKNVDGVLDYYLTVLRKPDLIYLYDAFVPKEKRLSKTLFDYVAQAYSNDIEAVFDLILALNKGQVFTSRTDIADLCGIGTASVESYIFLLLKPLTGSAKGFEMVLRNRIKTGVDLADAIGMSSLYNFMNRSLSLMCEIKMLRISGVVYKHIDKLPESFDTKALARYQKFIWRLNEIPLSELLDLRQSMGSRVWRRDADLLAFVYDYYTKRGIREVCV